LVTLAQWQPLSPRLATYPGSTAVFSLVNCVC
jgi:hypothetical protein